ncbi:MAG: ABC transporter permease, partial [Acidobacteria bacterium]
IFRVVYERDPDVGLANAVVTGVYEIFTQQASYPGAGPRPGDLLVEDGSGGFATSSAVDPGSTVLLPLVGVGADTLPEHPTAPQQPEQAATDAVTGTVWFDFTRGGGGTPGAIDPTEVALPGVEVRALSGGEVVGQDRTDDEGRWVIDGLDGPVTIALPEDNFTAPFDGVAWLGPNLVTPAIILAYVWMWAGFAMVLIGAGLAAISRDALEAARIDGANEWQVFRYITVPLLSPVLTVVFVTMIINVLKIFDLVYILAPGSSAQAANVIAVEMWSVSFGGGQNFGMGSALGVFLFVLVLPAMLFNIRRFRQEQQ